MPLTSEQRRNFEAKVDKSGECWLWTGAQSGGRKLGSFKVDGVSSSARRVAYVLEHGKIEAASRVLVTCGTTMCMRPAHLTLAAFKPKLDIVPKRRDLNDHPHLAIDCGIGERVKGKGHKAMRPG